MRKKVTSKSPPVTQKHLTMIHCEEPTQTIKKPSSMFELGIDGQNVNHIVPGHNPLASSSSIVKLANWRTVSSKHDHEIFHGTVMNKCATSYHLDTWMAGSANEVGYRSDEIIQHWTEKRNRTQP